MLNCTRGNTKSQLHKARRVLRGALASRRDSAHHSNNLFLVPALTVVPKKRTPKRDTAPVRA
jgi:hypothetical protein